MTEVKKTAAAHPGAFADADRMVLRALRIAIRVKRPPGETGASSAAYRDHEGASCNDEPSRWSGGNGGL